MRIERKVDFVIESNRRYIIRQFPIDKQILCSDCGEPMLTVEQTANFLSIKQRRIFQIIEIGAIHFTESESGALMICLPSLANFLDCES